MKIALRPNGDLQLTLTTDEAPDVQALLDGAAHKDHDFLADLLMDAYPKGPWLAVLPDQIPNALADAPCITDGITFEDAKDDAPAVVTGSVWWYPNYVVTSFAAELLATGKTVFNKARAPVEASFPSVARR